MCAGDHRLVDQQRANRPVRLGDSGPRQRTVGVPPQRSGPNLATTPAIWASSTTSHTVGPAQIRAVIGPTMRIRTWLTHRHRYGRLGERSVEAEMHMVDAAARAYL